LKRMADAMGVAHRIRFHGNVRQTEVVALLRRAGLFCLPSKSEGFPKAVLEAMAAGLPVVTTPVSVLPMLVGRGAGILLNSVSGDSVAAAVESCLSNPAAYETMSEAAIATARTYSLESWRDTIGGYLRQAWGAASL
jgi:glycosyltransferase involved in cell wall biosynthesis